MNLSKSFTVLSFLALSSLHLGAAESLVLHYRDGRRGRVELTESPSVRVENDNLVIDYASGTIKAPIAEVEYFDVADAGLSGIGQVEAETPTLTRIGDNIFAVSGAKSVFLFTIDGKLLLQSHGYTTFNLADYAATIFVVKADDKTFKLTNK